MQAIVPLADGPFGHSASLYEVDSLLVSDEQLLCRQVSLVIGRASYRPNNREDWTTMRTKKLMAQLAALAAFLLVFSLMLTACSSKEEQPAEPQATTEAEAEAEATPEEQPQQAGPVWVKNKITWHSESLVGQEPFEHINIYELDEHGNTLRILDGDGNVRTEYTYDEYGNKTSYTSAAGASEDPTVYENVLDDRGLPFKVTSEDMTTTYTYDADGKPVGYQSVSATWSIDESGNKIEGSDDTITTTVEFDENGFLTRVEEKQAINTDWSFVSTYSYELGENGLPATGTIATDYVSEDADDYTETTTYEYDANGNLTRIVYTGDSSITTVDIEYTEISDPSVYVRAWSTIKDL